MANTDNMAKDKCPDCGAMYALVGYRHNCRPKTSGSILGPPIREVGVIQPVKVDLAPASSTSQYRDREARLAYMRALMKRRYVPRKKHGKEPDGRERPA